MAVIKALSLWQPWASLIVWGAKEYETRDWPTNYRGKLAIHATKRKPTYNDVLHMKDVFYPVMHQNMRPDYCTLEYLPLSAVLCICELEAVYRTEQCAPYLSEQERAFGNYAPGRAAWKLKVVQVFDRPIPATGKQKLWEWTLPEGISI